MVETEGRRREGELPDDPTGVRGGPETKLLLHAAVLLESSIGILPDVLSPGLAVLVSGAGKRKRRDCSSCAGRRLRLRLLYFSRESNTEEACDLSLSQIDLSKAIPRGRSLRLQCPDEESIWSL